MRAAKHYNFFMRVFIAIALTPELKERIGNALKPFRKMGSPIRWIDPATVHLTLKFLGEVSPDLYPRVEEETAAAAKGISPFVLRACGFGKFPPGRGLTIFWAGIEAVSGLRSLHDRLQNNLSRIGFPADERAFTPHVTLGRNKSRGNFHSLAVELERSADQSLGEMTVNSFQIFESRLNPTGAVHTIRKEIRLD